MRKIITSLVATGLLLGSVSMASAAETNPQTTVHKHAVKHKAKVATHHGTKSKSHTTHKAHKTAKLHSKKSKATAQK
jgi:hypothetical protein